MTKKIKEIILVAAVVATLCAPSLTSGQQQSNMRNDRAKRAARTDRVVVKEGGWRIPGEEHFTTVGESQSLTIDGVEVYQKSMRSSVEDPLVDKDGNAAEPESSPGTITPLLAVRELYAYQVNERTFAYLARLVPVEVEANGKRTYAGAMYNLYFYDEDGDGNYETRYSALRSLKLPEWVRAMARR